MPKDGDTMNPVKDLMEERENSKDATAHSLRFHASRSQNSNAVYLTSIVSCDICDRFAEEESSYYPMGPSRP